MFGQNFASLSDSFHSSRPVKRFTHNFYRYPARCSDEFAHDVIREFTAPDHIVMDPFIGGGTTVVEGLALGRRCIGVDVNQLACFVTQVKTTPLSRGDRFDIAAFLDRIRLDRAYGGTTPALDDRRTKNLPEPIKHAIGTALSWVDVLAYPRQKRFIRCLLLRTAQQLLDCRDEVPGLDLIHERIRTMSQEMFDGLDEFVEACRAHGLGKNLITAHRTIVHRSAVGLDSDRRLLPFIGRVNLVFTSPPYPKVHVLYHRWQIRGRKETPAPFWISGLNDGQGAKYYTFGSRTPTGLKNYFGTVSEAFRSIRPFLQHDAHVVQLLGFSEPPTQLPAYLGAMTDAGYQLLYTTYGDREDFPWRKVPNRRWYTRNQPNQNTSAEVLLIHRPKR
ncbi:MAG: hypothetical protein JO252_03430 [Planctomycetaceae bacterium]|nr:hypothetical protein [Planctomycetaceae bacterium]